MRYKGLEARVHQMEKERKVLEDEIDKSRRIRSTLEAQLEKWHGVEGSIPEWKTKCSKLEIENARYMNEIKRLRGENDFLSQQVREVEKKSAEIRKYEQEINTHVLKIRDLEQEITFMTEEKKAMAANEKGRNAAVYAELDSLRERNHSLERQMRDMNLELQNGRAALSNSAMLTNKLKLADNENEGLKSMLTLNQKLPKNMIYKDDVIPGVSGNVDLQKLSTQESQIALYRVELARLFEQNRALKIEKLQDEKDLVLLKNKLLKKTGKTFGPVDVSEIPGSKIVNRSMTPKSNLKNPARSPQNESIVDEFNLQTMGSPKAVSMSTLPIAIDSGK